MNSETHKKEMEQEKVASSQLAVGSKRPEDYFFRASAEDFKKIPGSPIAYWVGESIANAFRDYPRFEEVAPTRKGMVTARNEIYVRGWHEVSLDKLGLDLYEDRETAKNSGKKWFSYLKGGGYRKWFGNKFDVVNWENDGKLLQTTKHPSEERIWATNFNLEYIFKPNVNWGAITSSDFSARISLGGELFDAGGSACFPKNVSPKTIVGFLNAKISRTMLRALNPTLNFQAGNIANLPFLLSVDTLATRESVERLISGHADDWDSYETSWDFKSLPLLSGKWTVDSEKKEKLPTPHYPLSTKLREAYAKLRTHWAEMTLKMQRLEEENNRIFIEAYGLQDELTPDVPLHEITLTCNPYYRYGKTVASDQGSVVSKGELLTTNSWPLDTSLEERLLADTMKEFISYAVGCMFGRYALDMPGLVLANQGETFEDYFQKLTDYRKELIPNPLSLTADITFAPDKDNVIPILDGDWFPDDITERFYKFLRVTFGDEHFEENLKFIEQAIGKPIRKYFLKDFYNDHVKRYKKRPIYWLFSSPKGSFNALIYMHRYRPDTVSVILNDYLREFHTKLSAERNRLEALSISASATAGEKTKALKGIDKMSKMITELEAYEREVLYPLATKQVEIDLDDGVKVNYKKFGKALKKVPGLS